MTEIIALLSILSGWLLFKLVQALIDKVIELLSQGMFTSLITYNLIRGFL